MNRRNFIRSAGGILLFSILPGAGRVWKPTRPHLQFINEIVMIDPETYKMLMHCSRYSVPGVTVLKMPSPALTTEDAKKHIAKFFVTYDHPTNPLTSN